MSDIVTFARWPKQTVLATTIQHTGNAIASQGSLPVGIIVTEYVASDRLPCYMMDGVGGVAVRMATALREWYASVI